MRIDANAYLGHWPFRRLRYNDADGLLRLMDKKKIDRAVVSSIGSIFYRNCHEGNIELAEQVNEHRDRLIPFGTINPTYPGFLEDLRRCHEDLGMVGVKLYPNYHAYSLRDPRTLELMQAATERDLPVSISVRMEDQRQRHWLVKVADVPGWQIMHLLRQCPDTKFILANISAECKDYCDYRRTMRKVGRKEGPVFLDTTMLPFSPDKNGAKLARDIGLRNIVFGSCLPFKYPEVSTLKVDTLEVSEQAKKQIYGGNILRLLGRAK